MAIVGRLWFIPLIIFLMPLKADANHLYGQRFCNHPDFYCVKAKRGDSWEKLFPATEQRDLVRRFNRMNINLSPGMEIAVPRNLNFVSLWDVSPFAKKIEPQGKRVIIFNQKELAWGAYDENGYLVNWGPAAGGKNYCPDVGRKCRTVTGEFTIYHKRGANCKSSKYPIGKGGAKMPHCMFFHRGYAFHGSPSVPGRHASHGCVRIFNEDAKWLNTEFINLGKTKVIIQDL